MIVDNLTHEDWTRLFGIGMGLFTVGAAWMLVGLQGPLSGTGSTIALAASTPFLVIGIGIITAPVLVSAQSDGDTDTDTDGGTQKVDTPPSSGFATADD